MIIYKATNLINNKIYIGQTTESLETRIGKHWRKAKSEYSRGLTSVYFHNALLKYGLENFKWEVIDTANNIDELNDKEIYWIDKLQAQIKGIGYNETSGGKSGFKSQEVKDKISRKKIENWQDPELAEKMREGLKKATKIWQEKCKQNLVELKCECCGKIFKVPPFEAKTRKYCSNNCANSINIQKATEAASIANHLRAEANYTNYKQEVMHWIKNNKTLIMTCPKNKISTTLIALQEIAADYNITDWRTIGRALCGESSKRKLLEYLQTECEKIC